MAHEADGRELHLFEKVGSGTYEYLGRFRYANHQVKQGPDIDGQSRSQILFHLELLPEQPRAADQDH